MLTAESGDILYRLSVTGLDPATVSLTAFFIAALRVIFARR